MSDIKAKIFVIVWTSYCSAEDVARILDKPILWVLKAARWLRKQGVNLKTLPIERPPVTKAPSVSWHGQFSVN